MTVESLETAKEIVSEISDGLVWVYKYTHPMTLRELYSIETPQTRGSTERSGFVSNPRIIYTPENGWSI